MVYLPFVVHYRLRIHGEAHISFVLCRCENRSDVMRNERRLRMFTNRVLKIF
jgi:hypothetical protein